MALDIAQVGIESAVDELTNDEAISLIAGGEGFWHTAAIKRPGGLYIPAIHVSDGSNGVRGNTFFMSTPTKCLPCGTALGATFDLELIKTVGLEILAPEAKLKSASVILGPTCNIQRSPLGGRGFESFSEDPYLSGMIAAAFINGVQEGGIGTTIKHFVCNDTENDRRGSDSVLSERALREIYLMPFMLAQKYAKPWSIIAAYNRVNGIHASENKFLLNDILRKDWGFKGTIMSDWFGTYSVDHSMNAGLDLEMPGPNKWRTVGFVNTTVISRKLLPRTIKRRAASVLDLVQKCVKASPAIVHGVEETSQESEEDRALMTKVGAESIVLLKNEDGLLPLKPTVQKKIAIVGGNAKARVYSAGSAAALKVTSFVSAYDGIVNALPNDVQVTYSEGAKSYLMLPVLDYELFTAAANGERGWIAEWYSHLSDESMIPQDTPMASRLVDETRIFICDSTPPKITLRWTMKLRGFFKAKSTDVDFEFGLLSSGRAKLYVDGKEVIDNWTRQRRGDEFYGAGSQEDRGKFKLTAGKAHEILVVFCNVRAPADGDEDELVMVNAAGVRLGGVEFRVKDDDKLMEEAIQVAKAADIVILIVGLTGDWEVAGRDRKVLTLPNRTDELVANVAKANKNTIVVTQSGSAITMPWIDDVKAVVHSWYLGNRAGDAIAQVLIGVVNPSGKLSMTFPKRIEDTPSHPALQSDNGKVRYLEDLMVGYKHYHNVKVEPLFAFGHGLSYTTFKYSDLKTSVPSLTEGNIELTVSLTLENTGFLPGSEVAQLYVTFPIASDFIHPPLQLKAFEKVKQLAPGEKRRVELKLNRYSVSYWDENISHWVVKKGTYMVRVGGGSGLKALVLEGTFVIAKTFEWSGI